MVVSSRSKAFRRNKALYGIDVVDNHAQPSEFVFVQVRYKGNCNRSRDKYYEF